MMTPEQGSDGRIHHTFRQSQIGTSDQCLEKFRRDLLGLAPNRETDAASIGTAAHAAYEYTINRILADDPVPEQEELVELYQHAFTHQMGLPGFVWAKYDEPKARDLGATMVRHWYQEILPYLDPLHSELDFDLPFYEDDQRVIRLKGTIDYFDNKAPGPHDWKHSGSGSKNRAPYQEWEYRRWAIQPTVYTWAAHELGYPHDRFTYVVMYRHGIQMFEVERDQSHWAWLQDKVLGLAHFVEANLPIAPMSDTSALCSQKWCEHWRACKGARVSDF